MASLVFNNTSLINPSDNISAAVSAAPKGAVWQRKGTILRDPTCLNVFQECNVRFDSGSQLLGLDPAEPVFKMWFSGGNTGTVIGSGGSGGMFYAESRNGFENWVMRPTAVIDVTSRSSIVRHNGTYYIYNGPEQKRFSSSDGVTFGIGEQLYFDGTPAAWEEGGKQNTCTWVEPDGTWRMMYEGSGLVGNVWQVGLATSTDGINWVRSASNPVLRAEDGLLSASAPDVHKIGDWYWGWFHGVPANAQGATTTIPTDLYRARSRDLVNWERTPRYPILVRSTPDEGAGSVQGQIADVSLIEVGDKTFMFYEGGDGAIIEFRNFSLKCAVANMTLAELVTTNEGGSDGEQHFKDQYGAVHYPEQIILGSLNAQCFEKVRVETSPASWRGMLVNHKGQATAFTVESQWPCPLNMYIGGGSNYKLPLQIGAGQVLDTPLPGGIEFDGTNMYFTNSSSVRNSMNATKAIYDHNIDSNAHSIVSSRFVRTLSWLKSGAIYTGSGAPSGQLGEYAGLSSGATPNSTAMRAIYAGVFGLLGVGLTNYQTSTSYPFEISVMFGIDGGAYSGTIIRFGLGKHEGLTFGVSDASLPKGLGFEIRNLRIWTFIKPGDGAPIYDDTGVSITSVDRVYQLGFRCVPGVTTDTLEFFVNYNAVNSRSVSRFSMDFVGPFLELTNGDNSTSLNAGVSQIYYK